MTPEDDDEMRRICAMMEAINRTLPEASPLREGLIKGALAIQLVFARGDRRRIEETFAVLQNPLSELTPKQLEKLRRLGIDPDADSGESGDV